MPPLMRQRLSLLHEPLIRRAEALVFLHAIAAWLALMIRQLCLILQYYAVRPGNFGLSLKPSMIMDFPGKRVLG